MASCLTSVNKRRWECNSVERTCPAGDVAAYLVPRSEIRSRDASPSAGGSAAPSSEHALPGTLPCILFPDRRSGPTMLHQAPVGARLRRENMPCGGRCRVFCSPIGDQVPRCFTKRRWERDSVEPTRSTGQLSPCTNPGRCPHRQHYCRDEVRNGLCLAE